MEFEFGVPELDAQYGPIEPKTFILVNGPIGSGKSSLTRQFIMDGVQKKQSSLVLSFETPNEKLDPLFKLTSEQKKFFQCCDASRWTAIDSAPWRNIDYIFDYLSAECAKKNVHRIIIDSFSHGFAFWSLTDILRFVDLCRTLHNAKDQCILWSINSHPTIESIEYIATRHGYWGENDQNNGAFSVITYSKWQKKTTRLR